MFILTLWRVLENGDMLAYVLCVVDLFRCFVDMNVAVIVLLLSLEISRSFIVPRYEQITEKK